ncbi:MAG: NAD(P)H-hydrate dehydratase [Burkholderiaceae bacterium]|nr:NAD(P)H-hydrate dehydratase [Burkholderiaceae bacterium]
MGVPLYSIAELRAIEQSAQRGLVAGTLMARAGAAAAAHIDARLNRRSSICVLAGPGNNGGDGYVTAGQLRALQHDVTCIQVSEPSASDARAAFAQWCASGGRTRTDLPTETFDLIVDALLGIGQTRPLQGKLLSAAQWIGAQHAPIVALDIPSGLHADSGSWIGAVEGVHASSTITFIGDKPGLHTSDGVDAAGQVEVAALGINPSVARVSLTDQWDFSQVIQRRRRNTHKGSYGNALIIGGNVGMVGAALLAARAALRIGAGRVYVDCIGAPEFRVDPIQPELMFGSSVPPEQVQAISIGCGLGRDSAARSALQRSLQSGASLVIDADALNLVAANAALAEQLGARTAPTVLTPHPLEAARLLSCSVNDVQTDRLTAARGLAQRYRAVVILKGAGTIVARADGLCAINPTGGPALASAGTGDVLAGMLTGLLAQGFELWQTALASVWLHGASVYDADGVIRDVGLVASDIASRAASVLNGLRQDAASEP